MGVNYMILGKDNYYSLDTHETMLNNNVLVVGASGAGKTRSVVIPNLLLATGSYIVSDPKGNLHRQYGSYLKKKGYEVKKLDFTDPMNSCGYNFFDYIKSTQDIVKVANMFFENKGNRVDPFWDEAAQLLLQACIAYLIETSRKNDHNFSNVMKMLEMFTNAGDLEDEKAVVDIMFDELAKEKPTCYAVKTYKKFRVAANRTLRSIIISLNAKMGLFDTPEIARMTAFDSVDIPSIGDKKTALFVVVSDTDRSMDVLANIFFTQAMNELCRHADKDCEDYRLPVPVRFILDDFATNCRINQFPRMIASIRSREISTMLLIQAESQLYERYNNDGKTIIGNCDTYMYMGGNDVETAESVSKRCDVPLKKVLNMPVGDNIVFRRGMDPVHGKNFDLEGFLHKVKAEAGKVR